jgi:hypothetical protein
MAKHFTGMAVLGCAIVAVILGVDDAAAQDASAGPGARVRIATRSELTARDIAEMAGAPKGAEVVPEGRATLAVHTREGLNLVLPVPGIRFSGVLVAVNEYVLTIKPDGAAVSLTVPRRAIAEMERSAGRRSRARNAGIGALTGFGGGGVVGVVSGLQCAPNAWFCSPGLNALAGGILGAAGGAVVGVIMPPAERWIVVGSSAVSNVQEAPPFAPPNFRGPPRVTVVFQLGQPGSGPAHDIEQAMRAGGFGDTSPAFFGGPTLHPYSSSAFGTIGLPMMLEIDYGVHPPWNVGVIVARTPIGATNGFNHASNEYVSVEYGTSTVGAVVTRTFRSFKVGAGPALHSTRTRAPLSDGSEGGPWSTYSRFGLIALGGVKTPAQTRVYLDVGFQYRYVGRASYGPFASSLFNGRGTVLPALSAQFSHWFIAFGPGVRF